MRISSIISLFPRTSPNVKLSGGTRYIYLAVKESRIVVKHAQASEVIIEVKVFEYDDYDQGQWQRL